MKPQPPAELLIPEDVVAFYEATQGDIYDAAATRTLFLIRALAQRINDVSAAWLEPYGLTALSFQVLAQLQAAPGHAKALSALTRTLHTRAQTITSLIHALERDGLVRRIAHATDGRTTLAKLTAKGLRVALKATHAQHENITRVMTPIAPRERETLIATRAEIGELMAHEKTRLKT